MWIYRAGQASQSSARRMLSLLLLEHHLLQEAVVSVLGVVVVNECQRDVAVNLVLIWVGHSRTYGPISVCALATVWVRVRVQGGAGLKLKSGQVLAKAVRSAFGNVVLHEAGIVVGIVVSHSVDKWRPAV